MRFSDASYRLLPALVGTPPFTDYCRLRRVRFRQPCGTAQTDLARRWQAAVANCPEPVRTQIEADLARVDELADRDGTAHLVDAAGGPPLPPPDVPAGPPLALWFLVHRPDVFREVFFHHESGTSGGWRAATARPRLALRNLDARAARLAASVGRYFRATEGVGQHATAAAFRDGPTCHFVVRVADRPRLRDGFTASGRPRRLFIGTVLPVYFTYRTDGEVRLKSRGTGRRPGR